jgi:hypothetical protein
MKLETLIATFKELSQHNLATAKKEPDDYIRGLNQGYGDAYAVVVGFLEDHLKAATALSPANAGVVLSDK